MFNGAKVSIIQQTEKGFSRKTNRKNPIKSKKEKRWEGEKSPQPNGCGLLL